MSTIPAGLRADLMRARMEDKATIIETGGLYMGSTTSVSFTNSDGTLTSAKATTMLAPGAINTVLTAHGSNAVLTYENIKTDMMADNCVTKSKLGTGTISDATGSSARKVLEIKSDETDANILVIRYYVDN